MLVHTPEFLAQGGAVMYPYKHEYAIIDAERKLYSSKRQRWTRQTATHGSRRPAGDG